MTLSDGIKEIIRVALIMGLLVTLLVMTCIWIVRMRRVFMEADRLARQREVKPRRWRTLNVVDRCDLTPSCMATSHDTNCARAQ